MKRIAGALAVLVVIAAAPAAAAAEPRVRDLGPFGVVTTDGQRYLKSGAVDGSAQIIDVATSRRTTLRPPAPSCRATATGVHAGILAWDCTRPEVGDVVAEGRATDLATGVVSELPVIRASQFAPGRPAGAYRRAGRRWAELDLNFGPNSDERAYVDRATGEVRRGAAENPASVVDLDAPQLVRPLCSPLRRPVLHEDPRTGRAVLGDLALSGRAAALVARGDGDRPDRVVLQRCGKRPETIRTCPRSGCASVVLDDRVVAWTEGSGIRIHSRRTGRSATVRRDRVEALALVRHRLYASRNGRLLRILP